MKVTKSILLSALLSISLFTSATSAQEGFIKNLANMFQEEDTPVGALARLYKQFEALSTPLEETLSSNETKTDVVPSDVDPSYDPTQTNSTNSTTDPTSNNTTNNNSTDYPIDHPDDPIFTDKRKHGDKVVNSKTPVWGVLTEPLRGSMQSNSNNYSEYIPASQVKFLEQTGAKVIPISYKLKREDLYDLLDQVSGLYIHGDSVYSVNDQHFQATFSYILTYFFDKNHAKDQYFPVFMMGSTIQSLVMNRVDNGASMFKTTGKLYNSNVKLRTVLEPSDSFIFDEISTNNLDEQVHNGAFFNRQKVGLKVKDFLKESRINKRYQIVATFKTSGSITTVPKVVDDQEFIAILESEDMPLYIITYNIDYSQFVFSNPVVNPDQPIDHTISSRTHAQFIAKQIMDEGKHCDHRFKSYDKLYPLLIRHSELANVEYSSQSGDSTMPKGLENQEIYFVKSPY